MANILIIDDDPVFSDMTRQRLERAGHVVTLHLGPFGATREASNPALDLILLDVFMPALAGPDLLEIMRKNAPPRAAVVFCSSMDAAPLQKLAADHGAAGFISKSASRGDFLLAVARVLEHSGKSR